MYGRDFVRGEGSGTELWVCLYGREGAELEQALEISRMESQGTSHVSEADWDSCWYCLLQLFSVLKLFSHVAGALC